MKKIISFMMVIIIFAISCIFPINVFAADTEYTHFLQGDSRWKDYDYDAGNRIGPVGCAITSFAVLMAYADPSLRDVNKFNPKICAKDYLNFDGNGGVYWEPKKGPLKLVNSPVIHSEKEAIETIKKALDKGYFVIMWGHPQGLESHYSPIVGWNSKKNKPKLWDVAFAKENWSDFASHDMSSNELHIYKSSKLNFNKAIKGGTTISTNESLKTANAKQSVQNTLDEWKLTGMPKKSQMSATAKKIELPNSNKLSLAEKLSKSSIQESMDAENKTVYQIMNICCVVAGLLLIVYSLLLCLSFFFDRSNSFIDLSLVSLLTVGKIKVVDTREELTKEQKEEGYVTSKALFGRCFVLLLIGFLLVSSVIPKFTASVIYAIVL